MNLWIITVNFGDTELTESLIDSLSSLSQANSIKVAIADNSSTDESFFHLKRIANNTKLDVKIFSNTENIYYWPAAKKLIENLKKEIGSLPDWIIVCNNDITFPNRNFINQLAKIDINKYPIVGPNIINSYGKKLNPFMISPYSKIQNIYWKLYFFSYISSKIFFVIRKLINLFLLKTKSKNEDVVKKVYAIHGSAILFSNYFFSKGGWLDDNFEMYGEELTLAEIAKKINLPITYFPELEVIHHEHNNTKKANQRDLFFKAKKAHKYFLANYKK